MRKPLYLFALVLLSACADMDQELKEVNALQDKLIQSEQVFQAWDLDHMLTRKKEVESLLDSVSNQYTNKNLVMEMPVGILMGDFKTAAKPYKRITADYNHVKEELEYSKTQLQNLRQDLESGAVEKESASKFISEEALAVNALYEQVFRMDTVFMRSEKLYADKLHQVDSLIATFH